ncbi:MAG: hypothetical protein FWE93_06885 [Alphaproteobacteria bacterium]|nr:hypothetical protein [Alphaproteobacteria bacterium]
MKPNHKKGIYLAFAAAAVATCTACIVTGDGASAIAALPDTSTVMAGIDTAMNNFGGAAQECICSFKSGFIYRGYGGGGFTTASHCFCTPVDPQDVPAIANQIITEQQDPNQLTYWNWAQTEIQRVLSPLNPVSLNLTDTTMEQLPIY